MFSPFTLCVCVHINRIKCRRLKANVSGVIASERKLNDLRWELTFTIPHISSRSMHTQAGIYPDPSISFRGNYYYCPQIGAGAARNLWKFSVWAITITLKVWVHTKHVQHKYKLRLNNCTMKHNRMLPKQIVKWRIHFVYHLVVVGCDEVRARRTRSYFNFLIFMHIHTYVANQSSLFILSEHPQFL